MVWLILGVLCAIIIPFCLFEEAINNAFEAATASQETTFILASILFCALALDIFLPVPSSLASTMCGVVLGFVGGFLLSFMAMNVSCLLGYLLGRLCSDKARQMIGDKEMHLLQHFFARHQTLLLVALRAVPVLAEASVLFAGLSRTPPLKTALLLLVANAAVSLPYAYVGVMGMLPAFLTSIAISALILFVSFLARARVKSQRL